MDYEEQAMSTISAGTFWSDIQTGLITSIVFAIGIWCVQEMRYLFWLKRLIHNQNYDVFYKRFPNDKIMEVKCKTRGNRIKFDGKILDGETEPTFKGEIIVNLFNLQTGEGYHIQQDQDANTFFKVILADNMDTFYIDAPYIAMKETTDTNKRGTHNKIGSEIYQAFVWKKRK